MRRPLAVAIAVSLLVVGAFAARAMTARRPAVASIVVSPGRFLREATGTGILKAARATPIVVPTESGRAQKVAALARDGAYLKKGDLVVEFDPWDAQREEADGRADLLAAEARIAKARAEGGRDLRTLAVDLELATRELARTEAFQLVDDQLFSRHEILESRLERDLFAARASVARRKTAPSASLSTAQRRLAEIDRGKAHNKLESSGKGLRALRITAPHDGILVLFRNWRGEASFVGDSVWPGEKLAEFPDLSVLQARVFVLEADAAGLAPGLPAKVTLEGRPGTEHAATVTRVDPLAKPRDPQSPVKYFEALLSLSATDTAVMKPGQPVRAVIQLEAADAVLAIPRSAVFERDGARVVHRWADGRYDPVPIGIGRNSLSRVVVTSGLRSGDRIALRDPALAEAAPSPGPPPGGGR